MGFRLLLEVYVSRFYAAMLFLQIHGTETMFFGRERLGQRSSEHFTQRSRPLLGSEI